MEVKIRISFSWFRSFRGTRIIKFHEWHNKFIFDFRRRTMEERNTIIKDHCLFYLEKYLIPRNRIPQIFLVIERGGIHRGPLWGGGSARDYEEKQKRSHDLWASPNSIGNQLFSYFYRSTSRNFAEIEVPVGYDYKIFLVCNLVFF